MDQYQAPMWSMILVSFAGIFGWPYAIWRSRPSKRDGRDLKDMS